MICSGVERNIGFRVSTIRLDKLAFILSFVVVLVV